MSEDNPFKLLFDAAPLGIGILREEKLLCANKTYAGICGFPDAESLCEKPWVEQVAPQRREDALERIRKLERLPPCVEEYETLLVRADGAQFPAKIRVRALDLPDGRAWAIFVTDVTERLRSERRLARINEHFLSLSPYADENIGRLIRLCAEFLPETSVIYSRMDGPIQRIVSGFNLPEGLPSSFDAEGHICQAVVRGDSDEPLVMRDLPSSPYAKSDPFVERYGLKTYIGQTLRAGGAPIGVLCAVSSKDLDFDTEDIKLVGILASAIGLEERRKLLEEQLLHSRKMDAIGRLAGGVAHDFNNVLTAVKGSAGFLQSSFAEGDERLGDVREIIAAADHAAALTRQLLAFSRRQALAPVIVSISDVVKGMADTLRRILGENVRLVLKTDPLIPKSRVDPGQLEHVMLNLSMNALDAMPQGGELLLKTEAVELGPAAVGGPRLKPGKYVLLTVSDTGVGMSPEVLDHIFEPFFTTKERGKGIGLGLSTVYGIAAQSGGEIMARSKPGEGSSFFVYLPACGEEDCAQAQGNGRQSAPLAHCSETILLVEDEGSVRALARRILSAKGYRILEAESGDAALKLLRLYVGDVRLLLTDVVMPGMNGKELAEKVRELRPMTPVLYISGYSDDALGKRGILDSGVRLLQKPFTGEDLVRKIRDILDAG
ncbi:MAG: response regulator [Elusimicrobia bacterium]|nr:response regulator [Elusimicrobiota bacterium]